MPLPWVICHLLGDVGAAGPSVQLVAPFMKCSSSVAADSFNHALGVGLGKL
jgi:hypothetical protein